MQFEKTEKKPAVIGWTAAAVGAFFVTEWLIHLPLVNVVSHLTMCLPIAACLRVRRSMMAHRLDSWDLQAFS